jgi:hypothetical protein
MFLLCQTINTEQLPLVQMSPIGNYLPTLLLL